MDAETCLPIIDRRPQTADRRPADRRTADRLNHSLPARAHPQERSRDTDDWPDNGRDRDSSRRRFARSLAALARRSAAGLLLLLATLLTVPAQAQQAAVPGAPTGLMATADAETNIDLAWAAPADTGGAAITRLSDRGVGRWRHDLERPGGRHRVDRHRLLAHGAERW